MYSHIKKVKVAHTRLPSVGFPSWSRFLAVSLEVTWIINPTVGCHYYPPGPQLPPQPLKRAATNFADWWTEAQWVWTVCLRLDCNLNPGPSAPEYSTLTTRLPSHPLTHKHSHKQKYRTTKLLTVHSQNWQDESTVITMKKVWQVNRCR